MNTINRSIPFGVCHCGCGLPSALARRNDSRHGHVKGQPTRFIKGHKLPQPKSHFLDHAASFKIDGVYCRLVPLTKGMYAIVDADDYGWIRRHRWTAHWSSHGRCFYAHRHATRNEDHPGHIISMQRQILGLVYGDIRIADHRETGHTLDNRRANLRVVAPEGNARNTRKRAHNTSGFKGVSQLPSGNYQASIRANGEQVYLGSRPTAEEAATLYARGSHKHHGEFGRPH